MSGTLKSLRAVSDATRLRIVALLARDELSVHELQEITRMGQSRISTHLGLLLDSGLVQSRREGKRTFYRLNPPAEGGTADVINWRCAGPGNCRNTMATRSTSSASLIAAASRRRSFSIRSPGGLIAFMGRAGRGKRLGI